MSRTGRRAAIFVVAALGVVEGGCAKPSQLAVTANTSPEAHQAFIAEIHQSDPGDASVPDTSNFVVGNAFCHDFSMGRSFKQISTDVFTASKGQASTAWISSVFVAAVDNLCPQMKAKFAQQVKNP